MKVKRVLLPMLLILVTGLLSVPLMVGASSDKVKGPECPTVIQMGEVDITVPASELVGSADLQFIRCAGMNIQVTGGSMLETPVIINAFAHHDQLMLRVYLQEPQPGPMDVTVWWRVD
jgi:hypothetical protein